MKRLLVVLLSVLAASVNMTAATFLSNSEVAEQWRGIIITVKNGGQNPDVVTLLKAFHKALPTWVVGEVLKQEAHPAKGTRFEGTTSIFEDHDDDEFEIVIDRKNGFVDFSSMTDVDQMEACVWRRSNGHRIFAVSLYEQHDPVQNLLCWYDYDPQTQTMKAEHSPLDDYKQPYKDMQIGWTLPRKGTDFIIREFYPYVPYLTLVYKWDGMNHHYEKTQMDDFTFQYFGETNAFRASEQGFKQFDLIAVDGGDHPLLFLKRDKESASQDWEDMMVIGEFKGDMQAVAVNNDLHSIKGFYFVKPEIGAPWTGEEVVACTEDFEHTNYYAVLNGSLVSYFVSDIPDVDDDGNVIGHSQKKLGYGGDKESTQIIFATIAKKLLVTPQWRDFELMPEEP